MVTMVLSNDRVCIWKVINQRSGLSRQTRTQPGALDSFSEAARAGRGAAVPGPGDASLSP